MEKKSSPKTPALPPTVSGINVNFCKNPKCANFGVPATIERRRPRDLSVPGQAYKLHAVGKDRPALACQFCGEIFSIKSNVAVAEEISRYGAYLEKPRAPSCPDPGCENHGVPVNSDAYHRFGKTAAGALRWRCKACGKTASHGGSALRRQRITHHNRIILLCLTNKMPLRRIAKITDLNAVTLYGKIDFLYRQCCAFVGARERELPRLDCARLYISVDRQAYVMNWTSDVDRRNPVLLAIGSSDNRSGYVFGMHVNFDATVNPEEVLAEAMALGEEKLPYPHRRYARLWLPWDYNDSLGDAEQEKQRKAARQAALGPTAKTLDGMIGDAYDAAANREDSEVSELKDENQKLPDTQGVQVHEEYCLYAHFFFLKQMLPKVGKLRFFLDQDSGVRASCLVAFADDIKSRRVDAFYVRTAKEMSIDRKRAVIARSHDAFNAFQAAHPGLTDEEVELAMMKAAITQLAPHGKWGDRWCAHPLPTMSEPSKAMCWLTNYGDYDPDHQARLFLKASLHGIDNFFQRVRRSLNPLERPLQTASKARRVWSGYAPYNPAMVEKLLAIYRVIHNYVDVSGRDKKTPAMRLGLTRAPIKVEDIIYFTH